MGTITAPICVTAIWVMVHSGRLVEITATLSPFRIPLAIKAQLSSLAVFLYNCGVYSFHLSFPILPDSASVWFG